MTIRTLAFGLGLALVAFLALPGQAKTSGSPDPASFAGTYVGWVDSAGERTTMRTTLALAVGGALKGRYAFDEPDRVVDGQVVVTGMAGEQVDLVWTDLYGTGTARFVFTADRSGFEGVWYTDDGLLGGIWTGCRIDPDTEQLDPRCPSALVG